MFDSDGTFNGELGTSLAALAGIRDSNLPWHAKLVACMLISRAQATADGWVCWPSIGRIAKDCGIGRTTAQKGLAMLRAAGLVDWFSGGGHIIAEASGTNHYELDYLAMEALRRPARR